MALDASELAEVLHRLSAPASHAEAERALRVLQRAVEDDPMTLGAVVRALRRTPLDERAWERVARLVGPAGRADEAVRAEVLGLARQGADPELRTRALALVARAGWPESPQVVAEALRPGAPDTVRARAARSIATTTALRLPRYESDLQSILQLETYTPLFRDALPALLGLPRISAASRALVLRAATDTRAPFPIRVAALSGLRRHGTAVEADALRQAFSAAPDDQRGRLLHTQAHDTAGAIDKRR